MGRGLLVLPKTALKSALWIVITTILSFSVYYAFFGNAVKVSTASVVANIVLFFVYYLHERAWRRVRAGVRRRTAKTVTWNTTAAALSFVIYYGFFGEQIVLPLVVFTNAVVFPAAYYLYENAWEVINHGKKES